MALQDTNPSTVRCWYSANGTYRYLWWTNDNAVVVQKWEGDGGYMDVWHEDGTTHLFLGDGALTIEQAADLAEQHSEGTYVDPDANEEDE